jgi:hypothetical protein
LAVFDPLDLAAKIAALQLMPENVDRLVRLSWVAGMVASIAPGVDRPHVFAARLRSHLNELRTHAIRVCHPAVKICHPAHLLLVPGVYDSFVRRTV